MSDKNEKAISNEQTRVSVRKVYCSDCRYLYTDYGTEFNTYDQYCIATTDEINYITGCEKKVKKDINDKDYPNKNGECKYYKRKWYKFWVEAH